MVKNFRLYPQDFSAGIVVFLIALPLCLGIALASDAPLMSGVISGAVGGIIVSLLSGSQLSVSGPAAGLTVVVATMIANLGSFEACLAAITVAGLFQIGFGLLRLGGIADYIPFSVIRGMLVGIGLLIVFKQLSYALGINSTFESDISFTEPMHYSSTLADLLSPIYRISPTTLSISIIGVSILILWDKAKKNKLSKFFEYIPGPLVVVMFGILCNEALLSMLPKYALLKEGNVLVNIPVHDSMKELYASLHKPNLENLFSPSIIKSGFIIALIASIETLLSIEATDKLDPYNRISSTNKELFAQGIGNTMCGLLGGLPITSVIVRSSANIQAGGRTRLSSFYHGLLLLISILVIPTLLNKIPLACLAAILIVIGYKLASYDVIKKSVLAPQEQSIPFIITVLGVVFFDLLTGVIAGALIGVIFALKANNHAVMTVVNDDQLYLIRFNKDVSFVHRSMLKDILESIPQDMPLLIDGSRALFVDRDIVEVIDNYIAGAKRRGIEVSTKHIFRNNFITTKTTHG
jgi:MFS superfamily sulfate permease-like transporter